MEVRDIKNFKGGQWVKRLEYKSFSPNKITLQWIISQPSLLGLLKLKSSHRTFLQQEATLGGNGITTTYFFNNRL